MAHSIVVDGEFPWNGVNILVNHKCGTSALLKPLISGVKMLYSRIKVTYLVVKNMFSTGSLIPYGGKLWRGERWQIW